jgi:hypothetical protein
MQKTYGLAVVKSHGLEPLKLPLMTLKEAESKYRKAVTLADIKGIHLVVKNFAAI